MTIQTLIAARNPLYARGIASALDAAESFVATTVSDPRDLIPSIRALQPDLVILDAALRNTGSLQPVRYAFPDLAIVAVGPREWAPVALRNGASGFVVDEADADTFVDGVRRVLASAEFTLVGLGRSADPAVLSAREHEVVSAAGRGLTNREIARELSVTEQTVKFHLGNAFRKLGVANRAQAAVAALHLNAA